MCLMGSVTNVHWIVADRYAVSASLGGYGDILFFSLV